MLGAPTECLPLPPDTARAGRSAFSLDHPYLAIGDQLDVLTRGLNWRHIGLWPASPTSTLVASTLITILQYVEDLSDAQAAEAARTRIDWKYALHLPLAYAGLQPERLVAFRDALRDDREGQAICAQFMGRLGDAGLLVQSDATAGGFGAVLERVACRECLDRACNAMCQAVEALATEEPEWLRDHALPQWFERYTRAGMPVRFPQGQSAREAWLLTTYGDMEYLLRALDSEPAPRLRALPEIAALQVLTSQETMASGDGPQWNVA
ncbi:MAG: transposase [Anaerolineae bacterium]